MSKSFGQLVKDEKKARMMYRRTVDNAYTPIATLRRAIEDAEALAALEPQLGGLADVIATKDAKTAMATIKAAQSAVGKVAEAGKLRAALSKVRRALRGKNPDPAKAQKLLIKALALFDGEVAWRRAAADGLLAEVRALDSAMAGTIGLRMQAKLPRDVALYLASCTAGHRDISPYF